MSSENPQPGTSSAEALRREYNSEDAHSVFVERLASRIFRDTRDLLGLSAKDGELLSTAAIVHDIGLEENPEEHNIRSREILLETGLSGFGPKRLKTIACIVTFHRQKVRWQDDDLFLSFKPKDRKRILRLAAILRVADGLDYTHGQSAAIAGIEGKRGRLVIRVSAGDGDLDVNIARSNKKADLWQKVMPIPVDVVAESKATAKEDAPRIKRGRSLAEAASEILSFHLGRMRSCEEGTRAGEDIDALHDMRVATRRLRAALRAFRKPIGREIVEPYAAGLKWIAKTLGEVRDLDVWINHLEKYIQEAPAKQREAIQAQIDREKAERETVRQKMTAQLDTDRFQRLETEFDQFLHRELREAGLHGKMGPFATKSVTKRMKRVLRLVPRIEAASDEQLHRLRILCKRLRYTGEFFAGCFGKRVAEMIEMLRGIQDALGDLHDTLVWRERIGEAESEALLALKKRLAERADRSRKEFYQVWSRMTSKGFQKALRKELKGAAK